MSPIFHEKILIVVTVVGDDISGAVGHLEFEEFQVFFCG
jgi:hypothetical protein